MSDLQISVGDVVKLKSGGPAMTVNAKDRYESGTKANCIWFSNDERKEGLFPVEGLELA